MLELSYSDSSSSQVKNHIAGRYSVIKDIYSVPSWINSALISQKKYRLMFIIMSFNHTDTAIETVLMNPAAPAFCQLCRRDPHVILTSSILLCCVYPGCSRGRTAAWTGTGPSSGSLSPASLWGRFCSLWRASSPASSSHLCTTSRTQHSHTVM